MNRLFIVLGVVVAISWACPLHAETHLSSAMGYQVDVPSGWKALDLQKIKTQPKLLESAVAEANEGAWKTANNNLTKNVRDMVSAGKVEYFASSQYPDSTITVNQVQGNLPMTEAEVLKVCESVPGELTQMVGRTMQVYKCQAGTVAGSNTLFLAADAYMQNQKSFQYEIQKSPNQILVFTANCPDQNCEVVHKDLLTMVDSIRLK